ncbi:protein-glutamine gamma-glutamyltransferase K-like [Misgurnus anguillicaudatus]|uniref:protein-glutamine gamma-glutamyltransferase K-like n=1 Tax=Misgurnus anguillicaudatus TaxID=75329 RepID=UPI003CCF5454
MPVKIAIGRFHGATKINGQAIQEKQNQQAKEENWFRKTCQIRQQNSSDGNDGVIHGGKENEDTPTTLPLTDGTELADLTLKVRSVNLLSKKSQWNRKEHHTDQYHGDQLIIRRGQTFQIELTATQCRHPNIKSQSTNHNDGSFPLVSKGTHIIIPLVEKLRDERWEAKIVEQKDKRIKLSVNSTVTAVIGKYKLSIHCMKNETADDQNIHLFLDISCCVDDYVDEEGEILAEEQSEAYPHIQDGEEHGSDQSRSEKTEHLLMKLLAMMKLTGTLRDDFLQYVVCPKCMTVYMLTETYERRRDGTKVCRTCGHIPFYNHPQQRSALRKKYGSALLRKATYSSGEEYVHPIRSYCYKSVVQSLGGLVKRLGFEEKLDERRKRELPKGVLGDVNDGQVWQDLFKHIQNCLFVYRIFNVLPVLSIVYHTEYLSFSLSLIFPLIQVLRCLGIPTRSVTNFQSAHDTDVSLTTDVYFDEITKERIHELNSDSVWNFHVWNDCWMARPDLPPGMGGWQAVDSTPQETSCGMYRCGPASLAAIRSGRVYLMYDAPFVFAEVNSDKIYWQRNLDGTFSQIHSEKKAVGHCISTKAVGSDERVDITHIYKHPEDSEEERIAVETACRFGSKPDVYSSPIAEDVQVKVIMEGDGPCMGGDARLKIVVKNLSSQPRRTTINSQVAVMYYTGVLKDTVKKDKLLVKLMPKEEKIIDWVLPYDHYHNQLVDQAALMLTLSGRVTETQQVLANQTSFRLRTPDLIIEPIGEAYVGKEMTAKITFKNPLPCTLRNVVVRVEGLGLRDLHSIKVGDVAKHANMTVTEHFIPTIPGLKKLVASLDCRQLSQVHGVANIMVHKNKSF